MVATIENGYGDRFKYFLQPHEVLFVLSFWQDEDCLNDINCRYVFMTFKGFRDDLTCSALTIINIIICTRDSYSLSYSLYSYSLYYYNKCKSITPTSSTQKRGLLNVDNSPIVMQP